MTNVAIVFHSGYGHTAKQAEAVRDGAAGTGATATLFAIDQDGNPPDGTWDALAAADAIIMGSPTYMGGVSWQFKKFADTSSKPWATQDWKDKVAGGFTNSASTNGDKGVTLDYLFHLAMQHSMVWLGTGLLPANKAASARDELNWLGAFSGAMAVSPSDTSPEQGPLPGDLEMARLFGARIAQHAAK
ncbi:MAG: flavodoxin family protein [Gemmatimonadaceae bacterium]|nr:flavodoxin family protein [Acetobacteraceae bacterium]